MRRFTSFLNTLPQLLFHHFFSPGNPLTKNPIIFSKIPTLINLNVIYRCKNGEARAQSLVFEAYGKLLFKVAWRYLHDRMATEDALAQGFARAFQQIGQCHFESTQKFEAWLRRIVINEALGILRERSRWSWAELSEVQQQATDWADQLAELSAAEILEVIAALPLGYRAVFNLAVIEGYTHAEIAEMLNISEGTSKSQLSKAKSLLQKQINNLYRHDYQK